MNNKELKFKSFCKNEDFSKAKIFTMEDIKNQYEKELEQELLQIGRVKKIEFDLDEFYSNIYQVIILATYDIPVTLENYFEARKEVVNNIVNVAGTYGLTRTEDRIEDYGTAFYFVFRCSKEFLNEKQ